MFAIVLGVLLIEHVDDSWHDDDDQHDEQERAQPHHLTVVHVGRQLPELGGEENQQDG